MNIALIGYGKMGRAIEAIALQRGHTIVLKIDIGNIAAFNALNLAKAEVAIEFSSPHSAAQNVATCLAAGLPVVCGSTGWLDKLPETERACREQKGSFLYSSNFSIGMNIFFEVNKHLASLMASHPEYGVQITETHHTQKKDAPSGTAITLAEQLMASLPDKKNWVNHPATSPEELAVISERIDPAPGTHTITYHADVDEIAITHTAHNRQGFATGAVLAAEFIRDKKGIFSMSDVLGIKH